MARFVYPIVILMLSLALISGCDGKSKDETLSLVLQGDYAVVEPIKRALTQISRLKVTETGKEHSLRVVKANPDIDYKIVQFHPHPELNYEILVIDPISNTQMPTLSKVLNKELRQVLKKLPHIVDKVIDTQPQRGE